MTTQVAVVTGGNKGIGYAIVRGLCKRFDGVVYLTSRDEARGRKAVADLEKEGLHPAYHQLDISDKKSIETFRKYLEDNHSGIDILINNAAIPFPSSSPEPREVKVERTINVNYFSVLQTCEILFPLIKNGGRVVNVSSAVGHLENIPSESLRNRLKNPALTIPELSDLMKEYVEAAKRGTEKEEWGDNAYVVSKVGLNALTFIQQRLVNIKDIKVNAVHPGYVNTDLTSHTGPWTIDEGARAPLYLALDADDTVKGKFLWSDLKFVNWETDKPNYY